MRSIPDIIFLDNMPVYEWLAILNKYIEIKSEIKKEITIYIVSSSKNPMTLLKQRT
jgi:hypothetical protein